MHFWKLIKLHEMQKGFIIITINYTQHLLQPYWTVVFHNWQNVPAILNFVVLIKETEYYEITNNK